MRNNQLYVGYSGNLKKRIAEHQAGEVFTTRKFSPIKLIYYEAYESEGDARTRESKLKQHKNGLAQLKRRIKNCIVSGKVGDQ